MLNDQQSHRKCSPGQKVENEEAQLFSYPVANMTLYATGYESASPPSSPKNTEIEFFGDNHRQPGEYKTRNIKQNSLQRGPSRNNLNQETGAISMHANRPGKHITYVVNCLHWTLKKA
ncbi:MAG: hypothetical protein R3E58_02910 [Phycisphaerae bacterium]|nr:hypothetical protein [Phycisphaerales bacterium]